jgi:hypothetical protein
MVDFGELSSRVDAIFKDLRNNKDIIGQSDILIKDAFLAGMNLNTEFIMPWPTEREKYRMARLAYAKGVYEGVKGLFEENQLVNPLRFNHPAIMEGFELGFNSEGFSLLETPNSSLNDYLRGEGTSRLNERMKWYSTSGVSKDTQLFFRTGVRLALYLVDQARIEVLTETFCEDFGETSRDDLRRYTRIHKSIVETWNRFEGQNFKEVTDKLYNDLLSKIDQLAHGKNYSEALEACEYGQFLLKFFDQREKDLEIEEDSLCAENGWRDSDAGGLRFNDMRRGVLLRIEDIQLRERDLIYA